VNGPAIVCSGGCGKHASLYRPICKSCAQEFLDWRKKRDGEAIIGSETESWLIDQCMRAVQDGAQDKEQG
jgi:hypothetical protein